MWFSHLPGVQGSSCQGGRLRVFLKAFSSCFKSGCRRRRSRFAIRFVSRDSSDIFNLAIEVWVREKTGCRRRNVINQDLGAEEQKASGVVVIIIDGVNTNQQSTTFQSFFGVSTHYSYGSVSSCSGPDPSSPNSSPSFSPIVESINHLIAFLDDLMRNFLESNLIWGLNEAATERMRGVSTINKLLRLSMMDGPTRQLSTGLINQSTEPGSPHSGPANVTVPQLTAANQDIDISSRLLRTRYRTGQLDAWFWVVLLRVLRFPPPFF